MTKTQNETNPAATAMANGVLGAHLIGKPPSVATVRPPEKRKLAFRVGGDDCTLVVRGREAQTLALLMEKGQAGFTSGEASPLGWARRTSAYIHNLRDIGVPIETIHELASDGSRVGRYRLAAEIVPVQNDTSST